MELILITAKGKKVNSRAKKEKIGIADDDAIKKIRAKCSGNLETEVIIPVKNAMKHLRRFAFNNALMPDLPAITISIDTLYTLLEPSKSQDFEKSIKMKGIVCGQKFAKNYLNFLRLEIGAPKTTQLLLEGWSFFDTGADWGTFDVLYEKEKNSIIITLENSFLLRGLEGGNHIYCNFIMGYIEGVLWAILKYYPRWFKQLTGYSPCYLEPVKVEEKPEGEICKFFVILKEEELKEAFDIVYDIERFIENDNYRKIPVEIRIMLEMALKQKLNINYEERIYVPQLITPFKKIKEMRGSNIREIKKIYAWANKDAHVINGYSNQEIIESLNNSKKFLMHLELLDLNEKERKRLRNMAYELKSSS